MSFHVDRLIGRGRMKRLYELLTLRHHADPDPAARARADIQRLLDAAFDRLAHHYEGTKRGALKALVRLQGEALDFYDYVLVSRGAPDIARLEKILREMDEEIAKLSRKADEVAGVTPRLDPLPLAPPPPKAWDDPTLSVDEFIAGYRARYPRSPLTNRQLRSRYNAGKRLNPATGELKRPVRPLPPPEHVDLPTDPARVKAWQDYVRSGTALPCFPRGTLVHVPDGLARIDQLAAGDRVLSWDETTGELTVRPVLRVHRNWTDELVAVRTDRGELRATRRHRLWAEDRGAWVAAEDLAPGTRLQLRDGAQAAVTSTDRLYARETTYNLEVALDHTYFVAEPGVLVHNEEESAFQSRDARKVRIYRVLDADGNVIYVGQTVHGDVADRLYEHINDPDSALYIDRKPGAPKIQLDDPRNEYEIRQIVESPDKWTPYEAAVWEQHFIDRNGGLAKLRNRQNAITPEKFTRYRNLHNPC